MALTDESSGIPATMLVGPASVGSAAPYPYPVYSGGGGNQGFGGEGGWWIVLLIIVIAALGGSWGNNQGGGFGSSQPIIVNDGGSSVQRGFDQAAIMAALTGISSGICTGFGDVQNALCSGFAQAEIADNARQMANMQQMFSLSSQFADCCCKNQLATESLRATVLSENCADRFEAANNTRDIITAITAGIQSVKDEICADRLEGYKRENDALRTQLNMATLAASQTRQTADIQSSIISELRACPIPSQPVYGSQPIFTCPQTNSCGCGCGCGG